eukprot:m.374481 g.374481  ORF g.374481 m.374481 type:complete len:150 (-) comp20908_c0_seq2:1417-1866(-)
MLSRRPRTGSHGAAEEPTLCNEATMLPVELNRTFFSPRCSATTCTQCIATPPIETHWSGYAHSEYVCDSASWMGTSARVVLAQMAVVPTGAALEGAGHAGPQQRQREGAVAALQLGVERVEGCALQLPQKALGGNRRQQRCYSVARQRQ